MRVADLMPSDSDRRPVYRQIGDQIRAKISAGDLEPGARLPPIRALANDLGVHRDTVALAYEGLASEGLLESVVGRGTFVQRPKAASRSTDPVTLSLAGPVERLLAFEDARPRYTFESRAVPLHSLIPDPAFYPVGSFRRCLNRVLMEGGPELLLYGDSQGHEDLRRVLAERFRSEGCEVGPGEIVLCHGASQGIALALRLFAQAGELVAVESPTYHNVLATLVALGLEAAPVSMSEQGPDLDALERTLARPEVKAFYTIPTFHNPMGVTTAASHRKRLLEVAVRYGKPVVEDGFEMDLRFEGRGIPSLAALDSCGIVVHLSSFSKSLFPGVRVGAIAARGRAIEALLALKHSTDLSDSMPIQAALAEFVRAGGYDRHLARMRPTLRGRRDALLAALEDRMPAGTRWTRPEGGYQVWVELPFDVDTRDLLADSEREGVLFAPGAQFLPDRRRSSCLRLTIARADEDEIRRGVDALARVIERAPAVPAARSAAGVHL